MFSCAVVSLVDDVCAAGNLTYGSIRKSAHGGQVVSYRLPSKAEVRTLYSTPDFSVPYGTGTFAVAPEATYDDTSTPYSKR